MATQVSHQVRNPIYCRNPGCNVELTFDQARVSKSDRLIPIEKSSGLNHQCKFSQYALQAQQQQKPEVSHHSKKNPQPMVTVKAAKVYTGISYLKSSPV